MSSDAGSAIGCASTGIHDHQVFFERSRLRNQLAARVQAERRAVEYQAVVSAHLVAQSTGIPSRRAMAASIWRRISRFPCQNGEDDRLMCSAGCCAMISSIGSMEYRRRGQNALSFQASSQIVMRQPHPVELNHFLRMGRREISLLVEHIVERQQALVLLQQKLSFIQQHRGIHRRFPRPGRRGQRHSGKNRRWQLARGRGQLVDCGAAAGKKARLLQKVGRRIAADGEFRENRQPRTLFRSPPAHRDDLFEIPGKVANRGVDLSEPDLHISSLICPA